MEMRTLKMGKSLLALCSALMFGATWVQAANLELHVATAYAEDNFQTQNLQQYANDVAKATNGQINFRIHPAGTLLKPAEIFAGVRAGKAEAGEVIMSSLLKENALFGIDSLPFIVSGYDDARRMWEASRAGIEQALDERGLQLLYAVPWPPQNLYAKRSLTAIQDFKGLRMRSYNPATQRIAELLKTWPVAVQAVDLGKAIADETIDLMITSSPTGVDTKAWSRLQYYYKVSAWIPKNVVFINKKVYARFDADTRKKIMDAARDAEQRGWKLSQDNDLHFENQLAANKINVAQLDPLLRRYLDRMGENLAREWLKQAGSAELAILLKYTTERSMK